MSQSCIVVTTAQDPTCITLTLPRRFMFDVFHDGYSTSFEPGWLERLTLCSMDADVAHFVTILAAIDHIESVYIAPQEIMLFRAALVEWDRIVPFIFTAIQQAFGCSAKKPLSLGVVRAHIPLHLVSSTT
jgi:hypothetical protein